MMMLIKSLYINRRKLLWITNSNNVDKEPIDEEIMILVRDALLLSKNETDKSNNKSIIKFISKIISMYIVILITFYIIKNLISKLCRLLHKKSLTLVRLKNYLYLLRMVEYQSHCHLFVLCIFHVVFHRLFVVLYHLQNR